jgi:hypothetical protein
MSGKKTLTAIFDLARGGDSDLTDGEFRLWTIYRAWQVWNGKEVGATVPDDVIAARWGVSSRKVARGRRTLLRKGYLKQQLRGPRVARYWAVQPDEVPTKSAEQSLDKTGEASTEDPSQTLTQDSPSLSPIVRKYGGTSGSSFHSEPGTDVPKQTLSRMKEEDFPLPGHTKSEGESGSNEVSLAMTVEWARDLKELLKNQTVP